MAKLSIYVPPKPAFTLGRLTDHLPDEWLQRLADPSANYGGGAMVRQLNVGDGEVAEFRCYLGMLIPGEMDHKGLGSWIEKEANPESYSLVMLLYRTFGPMRWGRIGQRFDAACQRFGNARIGRAIRQRAERVLDERGRIIAEEARSHEVVYYRGEAMERWQYEELFGSMLVEPAVLHDATLDDDNG